MNSNVLLAQEFNSMRRMLEDSVVLIKRGLDSLEEEEESDLRAIIVLGSLGEGFKQLFHSSAHLLGLNEASDKLWKKTRKHPQPALLATHDAFVRSMLHHTAPGMRRLPAAISARYLLLCHKTWRAMLRTLSRVQAEEMQVFNPKAYAAKHESVSEYHERLLLEVLDVAHPRCFCDVDSDLLYWEEASLKLVQVIETALCALETLLSCTWIVKESRKHTPELHQYAQKLWKKRLRTLQGSVRTASGRRAAEKLAKVAKRRAARKNNFRRFSETPVFIERSMVKKVQESGNIISSSCV